MAAQSAVMGEAFGKHYQYGKRKISSMTNAEFNKLDGGDVFGSIVTDYVKIIPQIERAMNASQKFQDKVLKEIIAIIPRLPQTIIEGLTGGDSGTQGTQLSGIPSFLLPATAGLGKLKEAERQGKLIEAKKQQHGLHGEALTKEIMKYNYTRKQASVLSRRTENQHMTPQSVLSKWGHRNKTVTKKVIAKKPDKRMIQANISNSTKQIKRYSQLITLNASRLRALWTQYASLNKATRTKSQAQTIRNVKIPVIVRAIRQYEALKKSHQVRLTANKRLLQIAK